MFKERIEGNINTDYFEIDLSLEKPFDLEGFLSGVFKLTSGKRFMPDTPFTYFAEGGKMYLFNFFADKDAARAVVRGLHPKENIGLEDKCDSEGFLKIFSQSDSEGKIGQINGVKHKKCNYRDTVIREKLGHHFVII